ncbi:GNAT family N-acetyltransferase [Thalassobacillus pellis]|uniref:GNAT family N-acetyltransferase n=1 Tax=Thalassobacillus pellis TaxID=748008 RepID=UPI0019601334|nr:GNAT family N-acetyltransferase [Thalassobacillus pellis]MBM7551872.1 putative GNAT family acetyltransferase [Thalassobacillus pellis]
MKVKTYKDPNLYFDKVEELLLKKEAMNNLALGVAGRLNDTSNDSKLLAVESDGRTLFMMMKTHPEQWILPACEIDNAVLETVVDYIISNDYEMPGIVGEITIADRFAANYLRKSGKKSHLHMRQWIYRLDEVQEISRTPGSLRKADSNDMLLITNWLKGFGRETGEITIYDDARNLAKRMIGNGSMYIWEVDGKPVSMVNQSRSTKNGTTINAVYTPDLYKGRGYATNAVWRLSRDLLQGGFQFCCLYTDADNPTSNSIYKKIGYYPIGKSVVYRFSS